MMEKYTKLMELCVQTSKHRMYVKLADQEIKNAGKRIFNDSAFKRHMSNAIRYWQKCTATQLKIDELQTWFREKYGIMVK